MCTTRLPECCVSVNPPHRNGPASVSPELGLSKNAVHHPRRRAGFLLDRGPSLGRSALRDDGRDTGRDPRRRRYQVSSTRSLYPRRASAAMNSHRFTCPGAGPGPQTPDGPAAPAPRPRPASTTGDEMWGVQDSPDKFTRNINELIWNIGAPGAGHRPLPTSEATRGQRS